MLNFFAVRLDCLAAKVKLLCYLARAVCSSQKLKHLHLAIGEALDAGTRGIGFSRKVRCTTAAATRSLKYNSPARTLRTARSTSSVVFSFMM